MAIFNCNFRGDCGSVGRCSRYAVLADSFAEPEEYGCAISAIQRKMEHAAAAAEESKVAEFRLEAKG